MQQNPYNARSVINGTNLYSTHRETRHHAPSNAERIGEQVIFYVWLAAFTATCLTVSYAIIKKLLG